jgi:hypothetical protein
MSQITRVIALSKGPNRIGFFPRTWGRKQIQFPKRRVSLSLFFNTRTMDRVRKLNISDNPLRLNICEIYFDINNLYILHERISVLCTNSAYRDSCGNLFPQTERTAANTSLLGCLRSGYQWRQSLQSQKPFMKCTSPLSLFCRGQ